MRLEELGDAEVYYGLQYVTFVDENGGENGNAGQRFHVYAMTEAVMAGGPPWTGIRETGLRWTVDLGGTSTDFYRLSRDHSSTQGYRNWYYKYSNGSASST